MNDLFKKKVENEAHHTPDKGKATTSPSSHMHLRDDRSHVINEVRPKVSTQPKTNSERLKCDRNNKGKIAS
jgi:hypothetical protein